MFLEYLQNQNKDKFISLCIYAAEANGFFANQETELITSLSRKLQIEPRYKNEESTLDELLVSLNKTTDVAERRIMALNILELLRIDNEYDDKEKEFFNYILDKFNIKKTKIDEIEALLEQNSELMKKIYEAIMEDNK